MEFIVGLNSRFQVIILPYSKVIPSGDSFEFKANFKHSFLDHSTSIFSCRFFNKSIITDWRKDSASLAYRTGSLPTVLCTGPDFRSLKRNISSDAHNSSSSTRQKENNSSVTKIYNEIFSQIKGSSFMVHKNKTSSSYICNKSNISAKYMQIELTCT